MTRLDKSGFTLIELTVVSVIIGLLATLVAAFYTDRLIDYAHSSTLIILQSNTKQALETVERDIKQAQGIEANNEWPDPHGPNGNQNGWVSSSASPSVLVLAEPTEDVNGNLQYVDANQQVLQTNDVIYYVDSSSKALYRRVIDNPICTTEGGTVNCKDPTTCPPASATSTCPADTKVIDNVANLVATYYDSNNNVITTPSNSYYVNVTLTQSETVFGNTYTNSLTSGAMLRNKT